MNDQSFQTLEYEGLRALVRRYAQTPMGRARADELAPLDSVREVRRSLRAVSECAELRARGARWSFSELADPQDALARLRVEGTILEPLVLLELARLCEQAADARSAWTAARASAACSHSRASSSSTSGSRIVPSIASRASASFGSAN